MPKVDLARFAGDWYVIGVIPTFLEKHAHNAVESYAINPDGTIAATFTFRKGSFDGPMKQYPRRASTVQQLVSWGYDGQASVRVPQRW